MLCLTHSMHSSKWNLHSPVMHHCLRAYLGLGAAWPHEAFKPHSCVQPAKAAPQNAHSGGAGVDWGTSCKHTCVSLTGLCL